MPKSHLNVSIDSDLVEIARIKRREDLDFNLSETIENFLYQYFETDI